MQNPIKPTLKSEILPILLIVVAVISSFYFYANFPEKVPIHWNFQGEPDNWGSRQFAAFFFPGILIFIYLLFLVIPYIDPKKKRYEQFHKVYHVLKNIIVGLMLAIYFISSLSGLGYNIKVDLWVPFLVGILFIILGNYMAKIKPNWFMGIRTPWTLSSEEVWNKTHRVGGKIFIIAGILMLFQPILPIYLRMPVFIIMIIMVTLGTVVYSYFIYQKEENKHKK